MGKRKTAARKKHQPARAHTPEARSKIGDNVADKSSLLKSRLPVDAAGSSPGSKSAQARSEQQEPVSARRMKTSIEGFRELSSLIEQMKPESGVTFVFAQHLDPKRDRKLRDLLTGLRHKPVVVSNTTIRLALRKLTGELREKTGELDQLRDDIANIFSNIQIPIIVVGKDLHVRYLTDAAKGLLSKRYTNSDRKITDTMLTLEVADLGDRILQAINSLSESELEIQDDDGHRKLLQIQPLLRNHSSAEGVVLTIVDAEERKSIEEDQLYRDRNQLQLFEEVEKEGGTEADHSCGDGTGQRLPEVTKEQVGVEYHHPSEDTRRQQLLDTSNDAIVVIDCAQQVIVVNKRGCELLECDEGEIVGRNWFEVFVPESARGEAKKVFDQLVMGEGEANGQFETPVLTGKGEQKTVLWRHSVCTNEPGAVVGVLSSGQDITGRRWAEVALRESEERLQLILAMERGDEFFIIDPLGNVVSWIAGTNLGKKMRGGEVIGKHFSSFFPAEEFVAGTPMKVLSLAEAQSRYEGTAWWMGIDGSRRQANVIIHPVRNKDGTLKGFSGIVHYFSELVQ